ncbi:MAG: hypothetical protein M0Q94_15240 [Candidatus Cloacimonetes bacterium]|nr:hypothetical protein [Candidatus Cloacimonadota bacterium]
MRDALLKFGSLSLATKATAVYSADVIDFGASHDAEWDEANSPDVVVKFRAEAAFASTDGYQPLIQVSADNSSWTTVMTGPTVSAPVKNQVYEMQIPRSDTAWRYMRVGAIPASTGTFTAKTMTAWIEIGGHDAA